MLLIDIVRTGGVVAFQPALLQLNLAAGEVETVAFRNRDSESGHWVTMAGKPANFWFPRPLARHTGSSPNTSSRLVIMGTGQRFPINYHCFPHAGDRGESGVIGV